MPHNFVDLVGKSFGKITVIQRLDTPIYKGKKGSSLWLVRCECGRERKRQTSAVKYGSSCGCDTSYTSRSGVTRRSSIPFSVRMNASHLKCTFKLSREQFEEMLKAQDNKCAVCDEVFLHTPHVDHDHSCCHGKKSCGKCIRGLLCRRCNTSLGNMRDSIERLQAGIAYLQKWNQK